MQHSMTRRSGQRVYGRTSVHAGEGVGRKGGYDERMFRRTSTLRCALLLVALIALVALTGCEPTRGAPPSTAAPSAQQHSSGTAAERLFPLVDRHMYHYATETDDGQGILVARVTRSEPRFGELAMGGNSKRFEYAADGVRLLRSGAAPAYVLKEPLQKGASWRGEHGGTVEIVAVATTVEVAAGRFDGCLQTVEQRGGDRPLRVATTFCPDVGIVLLEASSGANMERAELQSYGPPVDLGPDGIRRLP